MVKVIRYQSLGECFEALTGEKIDPSKTKREYWVGHNGRKTFRIRMDKWLNTERKCWGWVEYRRRTIHIWIGDGCSKDELAVVISHELGHLQKPRYLLKQDEEKKASTYADVTRLALSMSSEMLEKENKDG